MIQNWSIRSRATHCALSERAFAEGEVFHTAIYFDPETSGYLRRDVGIDVWAQEVAERKPIAYWRTTYSPTIVEAKPEVTSKESAMALLQRFIEEDDPMTENARYILALMLERKRILSPTATKEVDGSKILFYENKKTGEVFIVRDPDLLLSELAQLQDEVAMLLGFGGPGADAAKAAGMKFTPDGKLVKADEKAPEAAAPAEAPPAEAAPAEPVAETTTDAAAEAESAEAAEAHAEDTQETAAEADEAGEDAESEEEPKVTSSAPDEFEEIEPVEAVITDAGEDVAEVSDELAESADEAAEADAESEFEAEEAPKVDSPA